MSALLAALLLSGQADLARALAFTTPGQCTMDAPLRALVTSMAAAASRPDAPPVIRIPGLAGAFRPGVFWVEQHHTGVVFRQAHISVGVRGLWHGLRVNYLMLTDHENSDSRTLNIHFNEPVARVRAVLNGAGFQLGEVGGARSLAGRPGSIGVMDDGMLGAALLCDVA
jgi:hypothetical protein